MRGFPTSSLALLLFFFLIFLIPFFLAEVILEAVAKLGLNAQQSVIAVISILIGSMVNIPVTLFENRSQVQDTASGMFGIERGLFPGMHQQRSALLTFLFVTDQAPAHIARVYARMESVTGTIETLAPC